MFQKTILFFLIIILAVIQISLLPNFFYRNISPDVLLIAAVVWSAKNSFEKTWLLSIFSGLVLDFLSLTAVGANALTFLTAAFVAGFLARRFLTDQRALNFLLTAGLVVLGTLTSYFILAATLLLPNYFHGQMPLFSAGGFFFKNLALKISFNLILFPVIYWLAEKTKNFFETSENKVFIK